MDGKIIKCRHSLLVRYENGAESGCDELNLLFYELILQSVIIIRHAKILIMPALRMCRYERIPNNSK